MFKRKRGGGQRLFEQCSKKLHFSYPEASLIAMSMRKLGLEVAHSISQFTRPSQFEIVWFSSDVQSDTLCVIIPSLFKTSATFRTPRCNLRRWFWLCIKSLSLKRKCSSKERTICCAGQPFAPENTCLGRPHSVPTIIEHATPICFCFSWLCKVREIFEQVFGCPGGVKSNQNLPFRSS